ncbi:hypothetical protein DPMN_193884 [Dreissena polymorpha]|uniref:Ig-like domain-containing protein n=1 Tax=Dreissena polymorpha TaxID=45954 RepID=A0A9D3Y6F1_DREPO|nr:hypothetical protein DPMN_193884 [Dreissena polymorpha]
MDLLTDNRALPVNHFQTVIDNTLTIQKNEAGMGMQRSLRHWLLEKAEFPLMIYVSCIDDSVIVEVVLTVFKLLECKPPVIDPFRIPPRKQGDRLTLSCAVSSGDLPIYISWTKDFKPIPPHIGISVETSGSYSSLLKIDDVSPLHDGNYTCHAHNEAARTNFTALLHVDVPSSWIIKPEDTSVIRLNSVVIDCLVTGIPEPSVTWSEQKAHLSRSDMVSLCDRVMSGVRMCVRVCVRVSVNNVFV